MNAEMDNRPMKDHVPKRISAGLSLLPGDPSLARVGDRIHIADGIRSVRRSALRRVARAAAQARGAALALVDLGPSTNLLNKTIVMSCDACLPCTFVDRPSLDAACMLFTTILPEWLNWQRQAAVEDERAVREYLCNRDTYMSSLRHTYRSIPPVLVPMLVNAFGISSCMGTTGNERR
jgi:cellulose biosynthesis protein BcsQ